MFEELDYQPTPLGAISLRRRTEPKANNQLIYEVKLGEEFLMSSLFTESERQLAILGLAELKEAQHEHELDIVVGGLGLGYTAAAVLENEAVRRLRVFEFMQPVIDWHIHGMVPLGKALTDDPRCQFIQEDFFKIADDKDGGFDALLPGQCVHAILVDIDHSPTHTLNKDNAHFYTRAGLETVAAKLLPNGVFGLWSNDPPDHDFMQVLNDVFQTVSAQVVSFPNPYSESDSACTVYIARK